MSSILSPRSRGKSITLGLKLEIIKELEKIEQQGSKVNYTAVALRFNVDRTTIGRISRTRNTLKDHASHYALTMKKKTPMKEEEVAAALHLWLRENTEHLEVLTKFRLRKKAIELAKEMGHTFIPSNSWLDRFKHRHGLNFMGKRDIKMTTSNLKKLTSHDFRSHFLFEVLQRFDCANIFNLDETGIYYRGLPNKGYSCNADNSRENAKLLDKCTLMVCANMNGSEKRKLWVIGKPCKPSSFPQDMFSLPVTYRSSINCWLTRDIFQEYLTEWNEELRLSDRRIMLLVDTSSAHASELAFSHIEVLFLPYEANQSLGDQPMTCGIVRMFKSFYRSLIHQRIMATLNIDTTKTIPEAMRAITFLDAVYMLYRAWDSVPKESIELGFAHALLSEDNEEKHADLAPLPANVTREEFDEMIDQDSYLKTCGVLSNAQLINAVKRNKQSYTDDGKDDMDDDSRDGLLQSPSSIKSSDLYLSIDTLRTYIQHNGKSHLINYIIAIEEEITKDVQLEKMHNTIISDVEHMIKSEK